MMTPLIGKVCWVLGVVGWFIIRYPHDRRSRRTPRRVRRARAREIGLMAISGSGLLLIPIIYVFSNQPRFANYSFHAWQAALGALIFLAALWLFHRTHEDLGRNWSVTLELREQHTLVTDGVYSHVRHPMYSAFWLWAIAQALLLPNWIAGPAGLVGFGVLFAFRVHEEEQMMIGLFGDEYRGYMARTARIVPGVF